MSTRRAIIGELLPSKLPLIASYSTSVPDSDTIEDTYIDPVIPTPLGKLLVYTSQLFVFTLPISQILKHGDDIEVLMTQFLFKFKKLNVFATAYYPNINIANVKSVKSNLSLLEQGTTYSPMFSYKKYDQ